MYDINNDIPFPTQSGSGRKPIYPFRKMAVGDSFLGDIKAVASAHAIGRRTDMKFRSAKEGDQIRIWRIK